MRRGTVFAGALGAVAIAGVVAAAQDLSQRDSESMERKLAAIVARGEATPARVSAPVRTSFTERELNSYLKYSGHEQLPKGLNDLQVTMAGERRITAHAIVDLDAVRTSKERSWLDPASFLTGTVQVSATGTLQTTNGTGIFQLESATVGSLPIPKTLLQELVSYYARSSDMAGFEIDKPFELPSKIREVEIQRGAAAVIQP
jgi:hypothetical protein